MKVIKKIFTIRFEITEGEYAEAKQFFSYADIRLMLEEGGYREFRHTVDMAVKAALREDMAL